MRNPSYLYLSRHNLYCFRFPIPKALHPHGKPSQVRLSLRTREPYQARNIAQELIYFGNQFIHYAAINHMEYAQIRELLYSFFTQRLERLRNRIDQNGVLNTADLTAFNSSLALSRQALTDGDYSIMGKDDDVLQVASNNGITISTTDPSFELFRQEYLKASISFFESSLQYNEENGAYDFAHKPHTNAKAMPTYKLQDAITEYTQEKRRMGNWTDKSARSFNAKLALLTEILGNDCSIIIEPETANLVFQTLQKLPKGARSDSKYKAQSIEALSTTTFPKDTLLTSKTIATYMDCYTALYDWLVQRDRIEKNPFKRFKIKIDKTQKRDAFTEIEISTLVQELLNPHSTIVKKPYQKWGSLIGIYTGARLNEVAQLHTSDLIEKDGVWCFSINADDGKKVKTTSSERIIPIHKALLDAGILTYKADVERQGHERLLHELSKDASNGYGRNLGRWFNTVFLPAMGLKTEALTFHSTRHSMATYLIQSGSNPDLAKSITGHKKHGVFFTTYFKGHKMSDLKAAIDRVYSDMSE